MERPTDLARMISASAERAWISAASAIMVA
jgi:hypothetical protein